MTRAVIYEKRRAKQIKHHDINSWNGAPPSTIGPRVASENVPTEEAEKQHSTCYN